MRRRTSVVTAAATLAGLVAACGSSPHASAPDASTSDAAPEASGEISDAGAKDAPSEAALPGNALTGGPSFTVGGSLLSLPSQECGAPALTTSADGGVGVTAFQAILSTASTQALCTTAASGSVGASVVGQPGLLIQVASSTFSKGMTANAVALTPGTYPIGFEDVTDDDLCMLPSGTNALVDIVDFGFQDAGGSTPKYSAVSGTVTLLLVTPTEVAGSFDVKLGTWQSDAGTIDQQTLIPFSGTFDVSTCPGDGGP